MNRRAIIFTVLLATLALTTVGCFGSEREGKIETSPLSPGDETTYEYVVPFGTGNRLDGGEVIELMPSELDVKVGESIRIVNDDTRDYMIGPFFVTAGQTLAMRFTHPGVLEGVCVVGSGGRFVINVTE
ncbi:MAG: hypothetical protein Q8M22_21290 [Actinomycetota bacterium]|nr:hypothetical protein [Actinomycetota bacterium]